MPNLLVFDSGVGGLSVLTEIRQLLPSLELHYLMDNAAFPYGTKADDFLKARVLKVCAQAIAELNPDLLVVACNTASTLALDALRQQLNIPVVGVVPAIKVAAQLSTQRIIGLLATGATVNRSYTNKLIQDFAADCEVRRFGSAKLVQWAENWIDKQQQPTELFEHLNPWLSSSPELTHVVLGCTHFPLLKPQLCQLWPHITWVDSGAAIAKRVEFLLGKQATNSPAPLHLHWTANFAPAAGVIHYLQQLGEADEQGSIFSVVS